MFSPALPSGVLVSRARAESSSQEQRQEKRIGAGSEIQEETRCVWGLWLGWDCWNQGVLDAHKLAIPDAEAQVVKMFHICQFTELSWSNKDADLLVVC